MGVGELLFCTAILAFGVYRMGFSIGALQTLAFVVIVFGNQATTYTNRERRHLWSSRPSIWLLVSSVADLLIASTLAVGGHRDDAFAGMGGGRHARCSSRLRHHPGFGEGAGFPTSRHCLASWLAKAATLSR